MGNLVKRVQVNELLAHVQAGNTQLAEAQFNALPLAEQVRMVEDSGFNSSVLLLAKDATPIVRALAPEKAMVLFDQTGYGESPLLECATPAQYLHVLDHLVWLRCSDAKTGLPRTFAPERGMDWVLGLKDVHESAHVGRIVKAMGIGLLYCFLHPHVTHTGSALSLEVGPAPSDLHVEMAPYEEGACFNDGDIEDLLEKIFESNPAVFAALCKKIAKGERAPVKKQYLLAQERNGWDGAPAAGSEEKATRPLFEEVDVDLDIS